MCAIAIHKNHVEKIIKTVYNAKKKSNKKNRIIEYTYIMLMFNTGMRVSEIAKLKIKAVDIDSPLPIIRVLKGKTETSTRDIPIGEEMVNIIREYKEDKLSWGEKWEPEEPFFRSPICKPTSEKGYENHYTRYALYEMFKKILQNTKGIENPKAYSPHSARHTYTIMLSQITCEIGLYNPHIPIVSKMLGHLRLETTLIYLSNLLEQAQPAVNKLSKKLMKGIKTNKKNQKKG